MQGDRKNRVNMILGPKPEDKQEEGGDDSALLACCEELISAVHEKDAQRVAGALKSCWMELEAGEPPDEVA